MKSETEPNYLETLNKDLALALGDAVWAFARIEWLTYECLGWLSADHSDQLVGDLSFRSRTAILTRLVDRHDADTQTKQRARTAIKKADELCDKRNIIVHNPWRIWVDFNAREFMTEIQKYSNKGKTIDLTELRQFTETAGKVEADLREALRAL
jgi:hypothetical protein